MKLSIRIAPARSVLLVTFVLALAFPAAGIELRLPEDGVVFSAKLTRAYLPCTTPNTVSWSGVPACQPPVTSACQFTEARLDLSDFGGTRLHFTRPRQPSDPAICTTGTYVLGFTTRVTLDRDPNEPICNSPICTLPDATAITPFTYTPDSPPIPVHFTNISSFNNGNLEALDVTLTAPDGLPLAAIGTDGYTGSVGVAYPPCTSPDPGYTACSSAPWRPACDFNSGIVDWVHTASPTVDVRLSPVAGITPLCQSGTYQLAADLRPTLRSCDNDVGTPSCTLTDQTVMMPLTANGVDLLATGGVPGGVLSAQILGARVIDPTGALLATIAFPGTLQLATSKTTLGKGKLRIQALFRPIQDSDINPARAAGVTFLVTNRADPLFSANIPADRWQLQPPLGERWDYKDPGGIIAGVRKASIRLKRKQGVPIGYDVRLQAEGVPSASNVASANLSITIPLNGDPGLVNTYTEQRSRICRVSATKISCR